MTAIIIRSLGHQDYDSCWQAMKEFTNQRHADTLDELWVVEHPPVFTQGQNGKPEHVLNAGDIPVIQVDRGGQVTYHGPGQLMLYTLIDVKRLKLNIRQLVSALENAVIALLAAHKVKATAKCDAPGVYVDDKKICSVGLRIRRGCSYHGLALNVDMDLEPFSRINPCGYAALKMTQLSELAGPQNTTEIAAQLVEYLIAILGYTSRLDKME
ncbi:MAG: lipoyl(octanoyl) transferase LipB [Gammaproteobacteria bacterium]|nr:lipoyl(octanoyl) transferase LipB [Gammaproteobacteria bacterium]